jgi:hypothetical protein
MNTPEDIFFIVALVASAIEEVRSEGKAVVYWVAILICVGLLWHLVPGQ